MGYEPQKRPGKQSLVYGSFLCLFVVLQCSEISRALMRLIPPRKNETTGCRSSLLKYALHGLSFLITLGRAEFANERTVILIAAMTTLLSAPSPLDLSGWYLPATNDLPEDLPLMSIYPYELPLLTELDLFNSELAHTDGPLSCVDSPLDSPSFRNLPFPENHVFSKLLQDCNPPGLSTPATNIEDNEHRPEPSVSQPSMVSGSQPLQNSQATELNQEASQDESKCKDNLTSRAESPISTSAKDERPMNVKEKEVVFFGAEMRRKHSEGSPADCVTERENETKAEAKKQKEVSKLDEDLTDDAHECQSRYQFRSRRGPSYKPIRPTVRKTVVLWKFIKELLDNNDSCVSWISREDRTFRFVDSKQAAKLWGQRKNKRNMTYEKMSRALRYYYDRQIMYHIDGQKLMYRFGDGATDGRGESVDNEVGEGKIAVAS